MINAIYRKFAFFIMKSIAMAFTLLVEGLLIFSFAFFNLLVFYYIFVGLLGLVLYLSIILFIDYRKLLSFNWLQNTVIDALELDTPNTELSLKICLDYANGATYNRIKNNYDLTENIQVQRKIREGLLLLLKEHKEKNSV